MAPASKERQLTVLIGRFSPFHKGHAELVKRALERSEYVLIIIGSAHQSRTTKNPWTAGERQQMIRAWHQEHVRSERGNYEREEVRLLFAAQRDHPYNQQRWLTDVQALIRGWNPGEAWLTGADRDSSTFYLKEFPNLKLDLVQEDTRISVQVTASSIRDLYFGNTLGNRSISTDEVDLIAEAFVPSTTLSYLKSFRSSPEYEQLVSEYNHINSYKAAWNAAPYKPTFVTVDSVVVQAGHVLLIKRRSEPGKGLWALPGGFLNENEWMFEGAIRELREETRLKVPEPVIRGSLKADQVFDKPDRSLRGRTVTRAFLFQLPDHVVDGRVELPQVKGDDDAEKAKWFPLAEALAMSDQLFEDHHAIIETMLGKL